MEKSTIVGVVLAGGRATRMGGTDKGLIEVGGTMMVEHVLRRLRPQVDRLLINANRSHPVYAQFGHPVVADAMADFAGPLAGMAAAMDAAGDGYIVTVPCDSPLVPPDLVERLFSALQREKATIAVAAGAGRLQPVFALLPCQLRGSLQQFLDSGERKIDRWYAQHAMAVVDFDDAPETFLNINTPEERAALEARYFSAGPETGSP
ncbi:molybdopterin-guanine dinucleotide biosynthesis protein A [Natronocella acetinitrilica]|uniref:Molybdenum cofactor guanylyltransferase n=1 Tax=Natronocella acetinitrilica TaxID=414046 RepID=A0AAE3KBI4_9GAMM|nr:molybdopterin-guanine dinucleotide biosynthesis protein A [Natronocella acetinitrilica]